jgi:prepilin-type N-terminal cleavage/methylation domain-containing protein
MGRKTKNIKGFSLIEILVGMAILGVILTAIYSLFTSANKSRIAQDLEVEMQQNARSAAEFVVRELRNMNSLSCLENTDTACGTSGDKIKFTSVTDTTESRIFSWNATDNVLRFSKALAGSENRQPLSDHIKSISFKAFDDNNSITSLLSNVRRLEITLTAQTSMIDPNTREYRTYSTTTSVTRRN